VLYSWLPIGTYYKNLAIWWKSGFLEIWWIIWPIICMKNPLQRTLPVRKALTIMAYYWVHLRGHVQIWRRCHVHGCQIHFTKVLDKLLANPFLFYTPLHFSPNRWCGWRCSFLLFYKICVYYYFYHPPPYYLHFVLSINFVKVTLWILFVGGFACFGAYIKGPHNE